MVTLGDSEEASWNLLTGNMQEVKDSIGMDDRLPLTSRAGKRELPS